LNIQQNTTGLGFEVSVEVDDMDNVDITANLETVIGGRLMDDDLLNFVGVHFPEEQIFTELRSSRTLTTKPELNRKGLINFILLHILEI